MHTFIDFQGRGTVGVERTWADQKGRGRCLDLPQRRGPHLRHHGRGPLQNHRRLNTWNYSKKEKNTLAPSYKYFTFQSFLYDKSSSVALKPVSI